MKIGIDMGHCISGPDTGASMYITEHTENRLVGKEVIRLLREVGNIVVDCTCNYANSVNESLNYRARTANLNNVEKFYSIHFNAAGGRGTENFTYNGAKNADAVGILNNLVGLGFNNRNIKVGNNLAMISNTAMQACLIEVCFVDSADADLYKKVGYKAVALEIAKGIDSRVGSVVNPEPKPEVTYPDLNKPSDWAAESWAWGKESKICDGTRPLDDCSREEIVTMLYRFYLLYESGK